MSVRCVSSTETEQCAICADSIHVVRHAIVEVNVVIGVLVVHGELHVVRVVPVVVCDDAVVRRTLVLIALYRSHCFHVAIFLYLEVLCLQKLDQLALKGDIGPVPLSKELAVALMSDTRGPSDPETLFRNERDVYALASGLQR